MPSRTIWERELTWPKSGPVHWLTMYSAVVIFAGFALWLALGLTSPTSPDPASGKVFEVPGGRGSPPFYVDRFGAYALRFAAAHLGVVLVVASAVGLWNAGAKVRTRGD